MIIGKLQYNNSFSEVERELAQYILEHPESVVEMNIRQLALASYSSPATPLPDCAGRSEPRALRTSRSSSPVNCTARKN